MMCRRQRRGVRPPYERMVTDDGKYVVLIDRYAGEAEGDAVTIIGEAERLIRTFPVSNLLTGDEIEARRGERVTWGWWTRGILFDLSLDCQRLLLTCDDGRKVVIDLATGDLVFLD